MGGLRSKIYVKLFLTPSLRERRQEKQDGVSTSYVQAALYPRFIFSLTYTCYRLV